MSKQPDRSTQPKLGLACITSTEEVRHGTITRERLSQFSCSEQERVLRELYRANIERLNRALDFCAANGLRLYRLTSGLFPFADDRAGEDVLASFSDELRRARHLACARLAACSHIERAILF